MADPLSRRIGAFRKYWRTATGLGVQLEPEAVQMMDALFASFQGQARLMEMGPHALTVGDVAEQARLCDDEAAMVWDFVDALRAKRAEKPSNVVAFRSRALTRRCAPPSPAEAGEGDGGAA